MTGRPTTFDLRMYLPKQHHRPDAATVNQAFDTALGALAANGGGSLYVPPGTWPINRPIDVHTAGIRLCGAGMRATRMRAAADSRLPIVRIYASGVCLERMTLVGNLPDLSEGVLPNGLVVRGDASFVELRDVVVEQVARKAISFKGRRETPGTFALNSLRNVVVRKCGDDGIDFKADRYRSGHDHPEPVVACSGPRAFLRNISIHGFSERYPRGDSHGENGIDVRGRIHLHNIEIRDVPHGSAHTGGATAIVFRAGNHARAHGSGAAWSMLENYYVTRRAPPPSRAADVFSLEYSRSVQPGRALTVPEEIRSQVFVSNGNDVLRQTPARPVRKPAPARSQRNATGATAPKIDSLRLPGEALRSSRWPGIMRAVGTWLKGAWSALARRG